MTEIATLQEIRNRVLLRVGFSTDQNLSQDVVGRVNGYIRQATSEVFTDCSWVRRWREAEILTAVGQEDYAYPTTDRDGQGIIVRESDVLEVALWDEATSDYQLLQRTRIPVAWRHDATRLSGDALTATYARPRSWQPLVQLRLNPVPDAIYPLLLRVQTNADLFAGATPDANESVVDAELITLKACEIFFTYQGDEAMARRFQSSYATRLSALAVAEHPGTVVRPGLEDHVRGHRHRRYRRQQRSGWGREPWET